MPVAKKLWEESDFVNAEFELAEESYLLDNGVLDSKSRGVKFRNSPCPSDTDNRPGTGLCKFGEIVQGVPFPPGWVMLEGLGRRRFLPKRLQGVRITSVCIYMHTPTHARMLTCRNRSTRNVMSCHATP